MTIDELRKAALDISRRDPLVIEHDGSTVATALDHQLTADTHAKAFVARIVACWKACYGIPTEELDGLDVRSLIANAGQGSALSLEPPPSWAVD